MTETHTVSIEDVRTLVAERQRYDDWLAALEARRAETPARVFERVHADYSSRRAGVMEGLREHVATLARLGDELEGRLRDLETGLATLEDERIEAMLRTAVGEFDAGRWESVRQDVEARIAEQTAVRVGLRAEVDEVRALLASARSEPANPPGEVAGSASVDDATAPAAVAIGVDPVLGSDEDAELTSDLVSWETVTEAAAPEPSVPGLMELDIEEEAPLAPMSTVAAPASPAPATPPAMTEPMGFDDTADFDDALEVFTPGALESTMPQPAAPQPRMAAPPVDTPASVPAEPFDDLAFLRSVIEPAAPPSPAATGNGGSTATVPPAVRATTEPQKTLRCTECGTLNYPTEWYCERCGGELAAF